MEGRGRGRFPSKEELELWAKVTRRDEPLARRRRIARQASAAQAREAATPAEPREKPAEVPSIPAQPAVKPGIAARNRPVAPPPPSPRSPGRQAHRARPARDRRADRPSRHAPGGRSRRAAPLPRPLPGGGPPPCAHHHRQGHKRGQRSEPRFLGLGTAGRSAPACAPLACQPSMRTHVVSFTKSAIRHGGSGALYVTIRKGPRSWSCAGPNAPLNRAPGCNTGSARLLRRRWRHPVRAAA